MSYLSYHYYLLVSVSSTAFQCPVPSLPLPARLCFSVPVFTSSFPNVSHLHLIISPPLCLYHRHSSSPLCQIVFVPLQHLSSCSPMVRPAFCFFFLGTAICVCCWLFGLPYLPVYWPVLLKSWTDLLPVSRVFWVLSLCSTVRFGWMHFVAMISFFNFNKTNQICWSFQFSFILLKVGDPFSFQF